jgi:hypothetical protein
MKSSSRQETVETKRAESATRGGPNRPKRPGRTFMTVVLLDEQGAGEPDRAVVVGEDPDDVGAPADLAVDALRRVGGAQLRPVRRGEGVEGDDVLL